MTMMACTICRKKDQIKLKILVIPCHFPQQMRVHVIVYTLIKDPIFYDSFISCAIAVSVVVCAENRELFHSIMPNEKRTIKMNVRWNRKKPNTTR